MNRQMSDPFLSPVIKAARNEMMENRMGNLSFADGPTLDATGSYATLNLKAHTSPKRKNFSTLKPRRGSHVPELSI